MRRQFSLRKQWMSAVVIKDPGTQRNKSLLQRLSTHGAMWAEHPLTLGMCHACWAPISQQSLQWTEQSSSQSSLHTCRAQPPTASKPSIVQQKHARAYKPSNTPSHQTIYSKMLTPQTMNKCQWAVASMSSFASCLPDSFYSYNSSE